MQGKECYPEVLPASVDWASFMREVFKVFFEVDIKNLEMKLRGEIEVDKSHFGTKRKYDRGFVCGMIMWVVGLLERDTNRDENHSPETC